MGRAGDRHATARPCGFCGRPSTVRVDESAVSQVGDELETFGAFECAAREADRMHEFDHIVRSAPRPATPSSARPARRLVRSLDQEQGYRAWCDRRGLEPLPPLWHGGVAA